MRNTSGYSGWEWFRVIVLGLHPRKMPFILRRFGRTRTYRWWLWPLYCVDQAIMPALGMRPIWRWWITIRVR